MTTNFDEAPCKTNFDEAPNQQLVKVAIVGAGISGLYCAWRLVTTGTFQANEIVILERGTGVGYGRLHTDIVDIGNDRVRIEQGGMRFNQKMMHLRRLIEALGLRE